MTVLYFLLFAFAAGLSLGVIVQFWLTVWVRFLAPPVADRPRIQVIAGVVQ